MGTPGTWRWRWRFAAVVAAAALLIVLLAPGPAPLPPPSPPGEEPALVRVPAPGTPPAGSPPSSRDGPPVTAGGEPAPPQGEPMRLSFLGPGDVPLEGVCVRHGSDLLVTGAGGTVTFPRPAGGGDLSVSYSGVVPRGVATLHREKTVLRFPDLLPLWAEVVDGESGAPLAGGGLVLKASGSELPMDRSGRGFALRWAPIERGRKVTLLFAVQPPPGYAAWPPDLKFAGTVSRLADRVTATIPLRPVMPVRLGVVEWDGRPAAGARVTSVRLGGASLPFEADPTGGGGETVVRGIPLVRGEAVVLRAERDGRRAGSAAVRGHWPGEVPEARIVLPRPVPATTISMSMSSEIGIGGGVGYAFRGRAGHRVILRSPAPPRPILEVEVVRRDGSPARGVTVRAERPHGSWRSDRRTDERGRVSFTLPAAGPVRVSVREPGYAPGAPRELAPGAGEVVRVLLEEASPPLLHVLVLDENGAPVPFARLAVAPRNGTPYALLRDGDQRLGLFTYADGTCRLPDLPPGPVRVTAAYGTRRATGVAEDRAPLVLRLGRKR